MGEGKQNRSELESVSKGSGSDCRVRYDGGETDKQRVG